MLKTENYSLVLLLILKISKIIALFHPIAVPRVMTLMWQTELRSEKVVFTAEIHRAFDESERESLKEEKQARGVTPGRDGKVTECFRGRLDEKCKR